MKKNCVFLFLFLFLSQLNISLSVAQQSVQYTLNPENVKLLDAKGDSMANPWAGGLEMPQFSNIDLDNDGLQDLFVFDRLGNKVLTYISLANGRFRYAPEYEAYFPPFTDWVFLKDYNNDGKPDILAYDGGPLKVYKNVSSGGKLKFELAFEEIKHYSAGTYNDIRFTYKQLPAFVDIDGDGDLDIIKIDDGQKFFELYRNMSYEKYRRYDSLDFVKTESCWGRFRINDKADMPLLADTCGRKSNKAMHGGSTILALDVDGDGDFDLLLGDQFSKLLFVLKNGKIHNGQQRHPVDSMLAIDTTFPNIATRPSIPGYLTAFYVDINNDNIRDLIVVPQAGHANINQVLLYRNLGTDKSPLFHFVQDNFLQDGQVDLGLGAAPAFFDLDGDGLQDLLVATSGDFRETIHKSDRLVLYKNIGKPNKAVFRKINDDFLEISKLGIYTIVPTFGDINGDGKPDLLLGDSTGNIKSFINTGQTGQPATFTRNDTLLSYIKVESNSAPALADLDRDGLTDLVVGKKNGFLNYYRNIGTASIPKFKLVTEKFGNVRTAAFKYDYRYNPDGTKRDSVVQWENIGLSSPVIADLNNDGKWDMVVGSNRGQTHIYMNIEDKLLKHFGRERQNFYNPLLQINEEKLLGVATHPAVAFLNGDSIPDIMIGNDRGGLNIYASMMMIPSVTDSVPDIFVDTIINNGNSILPHSPVTAFKIYPNPTTNILYIEGKGEVVEIELYNMLGQQFFRQQFRHFSGNEKIDISHLPKGVYLLRFRNNNEQPQVEQVVRW